MTKIINKVFGWIFILLISVATFALYKGLTKATEDVLLKVGIDNVYIQVIVIIFFAILFIIIISQILRIKRYSISKVIKDIFKL